MTTITTPSPHPILDVQNGQDKRNIAINKVGIQGLLYPVRVEDKGLPTQSTLANFSMYVDLAAHLRGTHMSRFIEILNAQEDVTLSITQTPILLQSILTRLEAKTGYFEAQFPFFIRKKAPISLATSLMDYQVRLSGKLSVDKTVCQNEVTVIVPVTSLCPCSKQISDYGAHNQRSHVQVKARINNNNTHEPLYTQLTIRTLIELVEQHASCELYGILKRPDEKYVTEKAYDNPKFVEDVVRDIANHLDNLPSITAYTVSSENFESIHNHSAFAEITREK